MGLLYGRRALNGRKRRFPAWAVATMRGHGAVLRTMVEAGADAARAALDGATPLHKAASAGR